MINISTERSYALQIGKIRGSRKGEGIPVPRPRLERIIEMHRVQEALGVDQTEKAGPSSPSDDAGFSDKSLHSGAHGVYKPSA